MSPHTNSKSEWCDRALINKSRAWGDSPFSTLNPFRNKFGLEDFPMTINNSLFVAMALLYTKTVRHNWFIWNSDAEDSYLEERFWVGNALKFNLISFALYTCDDSFYDEIKNRNSTKYFFAEELSADNFSLFIVSCLTPCLFFQRLNPPIASSKCWITIHS